MVSLNLKAKDIATIGLLVAISSIARIGMNFLPNIQISTTLIMLITLNYGLKYGLIVAILTPLTSNMILGQGLWTLWQMVSWSLVSITSYIFKRYKDNVIIIGTLALFNGYLFGFTISIQSAIMYGLHNSTFLGYYLAGISLDTLHALGNTVFCVLILKRFNSICKNFK